MTEEPDEMDEFLELVGEEYEEPVYISYSITSEPVVATISASKMRIYYDVGDSGD